MFQKNSKGKKTISLYQYSYRNGTQFYDVSVCVYFAVTIPIDGTFKVQGTVYDASIYVVPV